MPAQLKVSQHAQNTTNPIRKIVDQMNVVSDSSAAKIALSIGDPTTDGNLQPPSVAVDALCNAIQSAKANGYPPSVGSLPARAAVAKYWKSNFAHSDSLIAPETVILGSGASQALLMAITALCEKGDNILLPSPGFSLYQTICDSYGITAKLYTCDPDLDWECNLDSIRAAIDENTRAILINNPSNPCGSNFRREHVQELLRIAEEANLPIISDEIYAGMVFGSESFTSVADFDTPVVRFVVGGTAKNFVAPGWRLGWVIVMDKLGIAKEVTQGIVQLSTLIVGPNSLVQFALDAILNETDATYRTELNETLGANALAAAEIFKQCPGLKPTKPQGAMYLMIGIDVSKLDGIADDVAFAKLLLKEENVEILPGSIFNAPNYFRIVYCKPIEKIKEAANRIQAFCSRHAKV